MGRVTPTKPRNSCHRCGATAYKTLIARDDAGAMRPSGQYQCVQCKQVFRDVREWRDGVDVVVNPGDATQLFHSTSIVHTGSACLPQTGLAN